MLTKDSSALVDTAIEAIHQHMPEEFRGWFRGYSEQHRNRICGDIETISGQFTDQHKLLEIGSAPFIHTLSLSRLDMNITGIDLAPERFSCVLSNLGLADSILKCDIEHNPLPFDSEIFDGDILFETFEHLRINLNFTMSEIHRVLKPDGILLLSTPNLRAYHSLRNIVFGGNHLDGAQDIYTQYEKLSTLGHMGHVREYLAEELVLYLQKLGLQVESIAYKGKYRSRRIDIPLLALRRLRPMIVIAARKEKFISPVPPCPVTPCLARR